MNILLIAIGGALGSALRYLFGEFIIKFIKINNLVLSKFPWSTISVNVLGSILAGILYYFIIKNTFHINNELKNFLLIGALGGFTTFSTFSLDFFRLVNAGQNLMAVIYVLTSVILAISGLFLGFYLSKAVF